MQVNTHEGMELTLLFLWLFRRTTEALYMCKINRQQRFKQGHHTDSVVTIVNGDTQVIKKSVWASVSYGYTFNIIIF